MSFVAVERLNKYYRVGTQQIHVLRDLDLAVERGEMVAVVGGCLLLSFEPLCSCVSRDRRAM